MSQSSEHQACGTRWCLYCDEPIDMREGYVLTGPRMDYAHHECHELAEEERAREEFDWFATSEQGAD